MYVRFITQISSVSTFHNGSIRFHQQLGQAETEAVERARVSAKAEAKEKVEIVRVAAEAS